ncbi:MAG: right-handed parallel beta-helix repeat-containing protein [Bacteroidales bacterium]|nr:MAG: right-handed parallel beta-helix repeat-containing protein [Bacteroidales bacterium]
MNKVLLSIKTAVVLLISATSLYAESGLIGWATYNDLGQNGTTGGGNGSVVRVTSKADLEYYAKTTEPYVILVEGSFSGSGMVEVESNKSIIGVGSGATFNGFGIDVSGKKNIIIRNLTIKNGSPDAIAIRNTHHVWVDHCDLSASGDGLLDFTRGSDYLTVSWTKFHDHDKVALVNSGTQHFEDVNKNKVTYHHNWFDNTVQRNPRVGYGMGHIFNNYYSDVTSYCVGYHTGASVLVENNYFYKSGNPLNQMYSSVSTSAYFANAKEAGNIFDNTSGNTTGTGVSFDPEFYYFYRFALDSAKDIPALTQSYSGPMPGIEYEVFPTPGNGSIDVHTAGDTLVWTDLENVTSWEVYFGTSDTSLTKTSTVERSFSPDNLGPDTIYYWKVDAIRPDTTIEGPLWKFKTAPAKASKPYPADGELHAKLRQAKTETTCTPLELTWKPGFRASKYKVYFGETEQLTESDYKGEVTSPIFAPGSLKYGVKYYWRIITVSTDDSVSEGDTWSFQSEVTYSQEGDTEVENMVLNGRAFVETQDGTWFTASNNMVASGEAGPGTMSSVWAGPDSIYIFSISYFDESDGNGWYGFYVNEEKIDEWFASDNNNAMIKHTINHVQLHKDDELRIAFYTNDGELNRTDLMNVKVAEDYPQGMISMRTSNYPPNQELTISIYSISGILLRSYVVKSDENGIVSRLRLNEQYLPVGLYIYTIHGKNIPKRKGEIFMQK